MLNNSVIQMQKVLGLTEGEQDAGERYEMD